MPDTDPPEAEISHVAVKPPLFWKSNPSLWFVRLEAQFSLSRINVDDTKFNYVVAALDSDILSSVSDILVRPPATGKYEALKKRLIDVHSESESTKIRMLLQGLELGDQRPSQLLNRMRTLGGEAVGEPLLKSLWLDRLPSGTQSVLAALKDDLEQLSIVADKIHELTPPNINAATVQPSSQTSSLEIQVAQLTKQVQDLTSIVQQQNHRHHYNRHPTRTRSRSRSRPKYKEASNGMCFYHTNFGSSAQKCKSPCSFHQQGN